MVIAKTVGTGGGIRNRVWAGAYAELQTTSHYSFLRGISSPAELIVSAKALGHSAIAITDRNTLGGLPRAFEAAKVAQMRLVVGCRLDLRCGTSLLVYPIDLVAYGRLCRMLSLGKSRAGKGACDLGWEDVEDWGDGWLAALVTDLPGERLTRNLSRLCHVFGNAAYATMTRSLAAGDHLRLQAVYEAARAAGVLPIATGDALYHAPERRILQDVVTCIRHGCTIDEAGFRLDAHAGRHLQAPAEIARLMADWPDAVARTNEIALRAAFRLSDLRYDYPEEVAGGQTAQGRLSRLVEDGLAWRYPTGAPSAVRNQVRHELRLIATKQIAPYFLTVESIVSFARSQDILCQGRGSAANSTVCFAVGITSIDPVAQGLLFERFVSESRDEPPDIDVDFESGRREEVIQWIYRTYGRTRAALTAVVTRFRVKGAVRDVGKVMGLSEDVTSQLTELTWGWSDEGVPPEQAAQSGLNLDDRRLRLTLELSAQLIGTPRHTSQHPGGFVLTNTRLDELVPIEPAAMADRQIVEWDKDDLDIVGFMKVDVLGLGMLSAMANSFELLEAEKGLPLSLAQIPQEDPATYAMIRRADTLGTFQIESRAQMAMLPRHGPRTFYDLVVQVAVVRPGPIQGQMVHPYLRRRNGEETVTYPTPELEAVLSKTLGIPLFQEQAMQVAIVAAGFTPAEADELRRAMGTFKFTQGVTMFRDKLVEGMIANGYDQAFAENMFTQLEGFGSYGFPESHAASFALIAYASSWMKRHHPDVFLAGLLNAQPMGFYAPAQLVRDAKEHGVEVRPVCLNASDWDCTLEPMEGRPTAKGDRPIGDAPHLAVRLGLRSIVGLREGDADALVRARRGTPYASVADLAQRSHLPRAALDLLAQSDALAALGLGRREAVWSAQGHATPPIALHAATMSNEPDAKEDSVALPAMTAGAEVAADYWAQGLSLRDHPLAFLRLDLRRQRFAPCDALLMARSGHHKAVSGLILVRQKPSSAKGVMFVTLEDETGIANVVIYPKLFEANRRLILTSRMMGVRGIVQRDGETVHLIARSFIDHTHLLDTLAGRDAFRLDAGRGDEARSGGGAAIDRRTVPKPRDLLEPLAEERAIRVRAKNFR